VSIKHDDLGYRYETWRFLHGVGALLIAGLLFHHALYAGRYSADPLLVWMWGLLSVVAVFSLVAVYVLKPVYQLAHQWHVVAIKRLSARQWGVTIAPDGHAGLNYKAGQFVWLNIGHKPFTLKENPFSISSAPSGGAELSFVIKELGDFTSHLDRIVAGDKAYVDGPHGTLTVEDRTEPGIAMIAGGVGVAPMLGILREMHLCQDPRQAVLIYGNRTEEQIVFRKELNALSAVDGTEVVHVLYEPDSDWTGKKGFVDSALISEVFDKAKFDSWLFVLCGPPAMMTSVEASLMQHGVAANRILSEKFQYD